MWVGGPFEGFLWGPQYWTRAQSVFPEDPHRLAGQHPPQPCGVFCEATFAGSLGRS